MTVWIVYGTIAWLFSLGISWGFGYYRGVDETEDKWREKGAE